MNMRFDKTTRITISLAVASAVSLGTVISCLSPPVSLAYVAYCSALSLPFTTLSITLFSKARADRREKELEESIIEGLYAMLYYKSKRMTTYSTMLRVARNSGSEEAQGIIRSAALRLRLGESLGSALLSACRGRCAGLLKHLTESDGEDAYGTIRKALDSYEYLLDERKARIDESVQKHATVNMFLATVLPSFAIFSFIGEIVLAQRSGSLFLLSLTMLIALPLMYLVGNVLLNRRLYG